MNMTRGWLSIAFACAFGALIGTLTALEISTRFEYGSYLWGIGALVGGIMAYVAIDFRHFCAGIARSYRQTIAWRPEWLWWKAFAMTIGSILMLWCSVVGVTGALVACFTDTPTQIIVGFMLCIMLVLTIAAVFFGWAMITRSEDAEAVAHREMRLRNLSEEGLGMILDCNPISVALSLVRGMKWVAVRTPSAIARAVPVALNGMRHAASTLARFVAGIFVYIHSQRRTICFVDATIGAAIGYSFGSAIIGTIAGAFLGLVNYEVVSVRLLRLGLPSR